MKYLVAVLLFVVAGGFLGCSQEKAQRAYTPGLVVILRHGEKPEPIEGIYLSPKGKERAQALVKVFETRKDLNVNGKPVVIYAMGPGASDGSHRPIDTIEPTSKALGVPMVTKYTHMQYADVAREVFANPAYEGKTVVICWEHHVIPEMAKAFGVKHPPAKWHGHVFDVFWMVTYPDGKAQMVEVGERALPGDTQ